MDLIYQFKEFISKNNLFSAKDKLLLAVSGGIDSVVLTELCKQSEYYFGIAHCNFQLRGEDSERDEKFVTELAAKNAVSSHVVRFDTKAVAAERKISTQEAARELRYHWFEEMRVAGGYQFILTAHHADDNIETVMMNFFRGTGIKGIRGIEPKHGFVVRPLLFARRAELEDFLKTNNLEHVCDYTNEQDDYTRNYFRHQVIPVIRQAFPEANENLLANISRFNETEQLYRQAVQLHKKKLLEIKGKEIHVPVLKLKKTIPLHSVLYEIISDYGFRSSQVSEVLSLLDSESGKWIASPSHRIIKNRNWLIIVPNQLEQSETVVIDDKGSWPFAEGSLRISVTTGEGFKPPASHLHACLDAGEIRFPLLLRKWQPGDYFYPLGMKKKKKLSRFFIDQKLSKTDKEKIWVIEMNKKILWIAGHRIDDRFKINSKTKEVLNIQLTKLD